MPFGCPRNHVVFATGMEAAKLQALASNGVLNEEDCPQCQYADRLKMVEEGTARDFAAVM